MKPNKKNKEPKLLADLILKYFAVVKPWFIAIALYVIALSVSLFMYFNIENYSYIWILMASSVLFLVAGRRAEKIKSKATHFFYLLALFFLLVAFFVGDNAGNFNLPFLQSPVPENLTMLTFGFVLMIYGRVFGSQARQGLKESAKYFPVVDFFGSMIFLMFLAGLMPGGDLFYTVSALMVSLIFLVIGYITKSYAYWASGLIATLLALAFMVSYIWSAEDFLYYLAFVLGVVGVYESRKLFGHE